MSTLTQPPGGFGAVKKPPRPAKPNPTSGLANGDLPPKKRLELIYGGSEDQQAPSSRNNTSEIQFQYGNIVGT
jgi:hypothetical protein